MKIKMTVRQVGNDEAWDPSHTWEEELDTEETYCLNGAVDNLNAGQYGLLVVGYFNSTLKTGESPRELVSSVEISTLMADED